MPSPSKREQIIDVALNLFYQGGFNATSVDKIVAASGVTKKTLYAHFKSKDELMLATLRHRDERFRNYFMRETERLGRTPRQKLEVIFDVADAWFNSGDFSGCLFINASAEFGAPDNPCHAVSAEHKRLMYEYVRGLAAAAGANAPAKLAEALSFLMNGAIVHAYVCGDKKAALKAKKMAQMFIAQALAS